MVTLREAAKSAERALATTLETALKILHDSALAAADVSFRDAAARAGLNMKSPKFQLHSQSQGSSESGMPGDDTDQRQGQTSNLDPGSETSWRQDAHHGSACKVQPTLANSHEFEGLSVDSAACGTSSEHSFAV